MGGWSCMMLPGLPKEGSRVTVWRPVTGQRHCVQQAELGEPPPKKVIGRAGSSTSQRGNRNAQTKMAIGQLLREAASHSPAISWSR